MWIDVTDVIEFLETEPLVTAIQRVAVDLTTAGAAPRQRGRSIEQRSNQTAVWRLVKKLPLLKREWEKSIDRQCYR
jgi:hypothetical protein